MKLGRLCEIEGSILKFRVPSLWPRYVGESRTTFAKAYGIKVSGKSLLCAPHNPPPPQTKKTKKKALHGKLTVHCPSEKWTVHSPHQT
jgi:hypothetical protein